MDVADLLKENVNLEILLPKGAKIYVKGEDKVERGDLLAWLKEETEEFDLVGLLGLNSSQVGRHLLASLGSKVKKGQILAQKRGLFKKKFFKSPVNGVLESLSEKGILRIKKDTKKGKVLAPTKGKVKKIGDNLITLEVPVIKVKGNFCLGLGSWGEIKIVSDKEKGVLADLDSEIEEKLLFFKGIVPTVLAYKAEALGAAGLVVGAVDKGVKPDQTAILSLGGKDGLIEDSLWKALVQFEGQPAKALSEENLLLISY